ncbi:hypothetical protein GCM10023191_071110 [Actinoallomurus oryzae]|uniref:Transposase n=1 Tax=Actinoallomurus oryzae TaxID=502180 RepID=A0ABP8QRM8_9ACTN
MGFVLRQARLRADEELRFDGTAVTPQPANAVGEGFAVALQIVPEYPPEHPGRPSRWGLRQGAVAALDDRQYSAQHGNHDKNAQKAEREP